MTNYRFLRTETLQLSELQMQDLVGTPLEARFNRLARLAREALHVRAAAVSLIDWDREWFKAVVGWNVAELSRPRSLAAALLDPAGPAVVADTLQDERSRDHPLVTGAPGFRFCAVFPLLDRFGNPIGALTGYDVQPRKPTARLVEALTDLGELAQRELFVLELGSAQQQLLAKLDATRREALIDELTRLWNRRGGLELLRQALARPARHARLGICAVDVDRFKSINDRYGHAAGDTVLRKVGTLLVDSIRPDDVACRLGGDEFLLVFPDLGASEITQIVERIRGRAQALSIRTPRGPLEVTLSLGGLTCVPQEGTSAEGLLQRADEVLYQAKESGRNRAIVLDAGRAA